MIALSTSVLPLPAKAAPAPPQGPATGDFSQTLAGLTDAPPATPVTAKPTVLPGLPTGRAKPGLPDVSRLADPETDAVPVTISAFLDSADAAGDGATTLPALLGVKGQDVAGDGKTLPADTSDDDASKDVIWLPSALLPIQLPVSRPSGLPKFGAPVAPVAGEVAPVALPAAAPLAGSTPIALPTGEGGDAPTVVSMPDPVGPDILIAGDGGTLPRPRLISVENTVTVPVETQKADLPIRVDTSVPIATSAAQPQTPTTQPAGQVFAAAIASAVQQARRDDRDPTDSRTPLTVAATALEALHTHAVSATADAKQTALDLKQDSGLQGMIDHIETLRDGADANDTRIRLVPDALGAVDVSVRKDGERVHVHFAAENRASAQLLTDAQPRLAELAEARGVKLGQTSVDTGTDSGARQMRQPAPASLSNRPVSAIGAENSETTDSRIA